MPKIARYGSKVMKNNNINQQKQTIKESQATRKYKPSALPLADLIRSIVFKKNKKS